MDLIVTKFSMSQISNQSIISPGRFSRIDSFSYISLYIVPYWYTPPHKSKGKCIKCVKWSDYYPYVGF